MDLNGSPDVSDAVRWLRLIFQFHWENDWFEFNQKPMLNVNIIRRCRESVCVCVIKVCIANQIIHNTLINFESHLTHQPFFDYVLFPLLIWLIWLKQRTLCNLYSLTNEWFVVDCCSVSFTFHTTFEADAVLYSLLFWLKNLCQWKINNMNVNGNNH